MSEQVLPTIDYLREWYSYDPDTGILSGKKKKHCRRSEIGMPIGHRDTKGRLRMGIGKRTFAVHHVCWAIHFGYWPNDQLDHENWVKTDNRIENLREATNAQNCRNRLNSTNTSGYKGVSFHKRTGKYHSRIMTDGKMMFLGEFNDPMLAGHAYNKAAVEYHKEFAILNVVGI